MNNPKSKKTNSLSAHMPFRSFGLAQVKMVWRTAAGGYRVKTDLKCQGNSHRTPWGTSPHAKCGTAHASIVVMDKNLLHPQTDWTLLSPLHSTTISI
jgi:hypothetical protein